MSGENKRQHLEMIQGVINRMAGNLFFLKGWAITLIAALFALAAKGTDPRYIFIAYYPVIIFWVMDGYFLSQERLFRDLYNAVRKLDENKIDFSMDTTPYKENPGRGWCRCMFSRTIAAFYVPLLLIILLVTYSTR